MAKSADCTCLRDLPPEKRLRLEGLSQREAEAALLVGKGLLVRDVAMTMQVSQGTAKTLIKRSREKLGCRHVRELMSVLHRMGVIRTENSPQDTSEEAGEKTRV